MNIEYGAAGDGRPTRAVLASGGSAQIEYETDGVAAVVRPDGQKISLSYSTLTAPAFRYSEPYLSAVTFSDGKVKALAYVDALVAPGVNVGMSTAMNAMSLYHSVPPAGGSGDPAGIESGLFARFVLKGRSPKNLAGITDERGLFFASFSYDEKGRAVSTEHAGAVNRYTFQHSNLSTLVVEPLGAQTRFSFQTVNGVHRLVAWDRGTVGNTALYAQAYDSNGNPIHWYSHRQSAWTCFQYDAATAREVVRVEQLPYGTNCGSINLSTYQPLAGTLQRKILTQWHPDWRLETRRSEPKKITTWVYNGQPDPTAGNAITTCAPSDALVDGKPIAVVCKQVEQATSDETGGAGFGATAVGTARIQRWTYNRWGQVLTANGPRTDNPGGRDDLTTYEYYADTQTDWTMGDLKQVTNPLGHITRYPKYDRNGRLLQQIDPNGTVTEYAYTPRGWLKEVKLTPAGSSTSQTTVYEYDAVGQMTKATLPDGTSTTYTYDAARRLTDVTDSAGNRVSYTLDAMGNLTREEWKDPGGTLRKTITRTIDALNRVQQVVGAVQ